ncbi:hypothetical protein LBMAG42_26510 [Deltaproteobacteria bacterium]|nr:hypothetical protein LBMAG42_26510 [Deltaproteobacteria bacterium]
MLVFLAIASASTPVLIWDLEQDDGGFMAGGELGQWRWGEVVSGPGSGFDGQNSWAIGLEDVYLNDSVETLELPIPSLLGIARPVLSLQHWYSFGPGDYGYVEIDEGSGWHAVEPVYGYPSALGWSGTSGGWQAATLDLPTGGASLRLRLVFVADVAGVGVGWFLDQVGIWDGDVTAPQVDSLEALADTEDLNGPYVVHAQVQDDTEVDAVSLSWSASTGGGGSVAMSTSDGTNWAGELPGQAAGTVVRYHVVATDGANSVREPASTEAGFRVFLAAPTGLSGPEGRVVAQEAPLSWTAPASIHEVERYEVLREGAVVATSRTTSATVALAGEADVFTVRAVYDVGEGDESAPCTVSAVVPSLVALEPGEGYPGDALRVTVIGQDALFVSGEVTADFGDDAIVDAITVRDVDRFVAELRLAQDAAAGTWTVTVVSAAGTLELPAGFTMLDAADRPRIMGLEPESLAQGASENVRISLSTVPASVPTITLGEGVVVESVAVEGADLIVQVSVASDAPLGDHAVVVDDGVRVLDGASLEVRDWSPPVIRACATAGSAGTGASAYGALMVFAALLRRRRKSRVV